MKTNLFLLILEVIFTFSLTSQSLYVPKSNIIAHRGYWNVTGSVENSLSSLKNASESGFYGSEFDVRQTKDSVMIVCHDPIYAGLDVSGSKYEDLSKVYLSNGETLPTLESFLKEGLTTPEDFKLVMEIKSADIRKIVKMVDSLKISHKVEFISFSYDYCQQIIKLDKKYKVYYLSGNLSPDSLYKYGFSGFDYSYDVIDKNPGWIKRANELGLKTGVWTIYGIENIRKYYQLGIDLITTDSPFYAKEPKISIVDGMLDISSDNINEVIYYTTDNSDPNISGKIYTTKIKINGDCVVKAISKRNSYFTSSIVSYSYQDENSTNQNINNANKRILKTIYYNMEGKEIVNPKQGLYVIKSYFDDGSVTVKKIFIKKFQ